jgi:nucleotide-binding universal stress UspA family protein
MCAAKIGTVKILLAIDQSEFSDIATQALTGQIRTPDTEVMVLNVVEEEEILGWPLGWTEDQEKRARELVARSSQALRCAGFKVECTVFKGDAREAILDLAEEWQADLIVLGSRGHTALERFLVGSTSDAVMQYAHCSVEIVRPARRGE